MFEQIKCLYTVQYFFFRWDLTFIISVSSLCAVTYSSHRRSLPFSFHWFHCRIIKSFLFTQIATIRNNNNWVFSFWNQFFLVISICDCHSTHNDLIRQYKLSVGWRQLLFSRNFWVKPPDSAGWRNIQKKTNNFYFVSFLSLSLLRLIFHAFFENK